MEFNNPLVAIYERLLIFRMKLFRAGLAFVKNRQKHCKPKTFTLHLQRQPINVANKYEPYIHSAL